MKKQTGRYTTRRKKAARWLTSCADEDVGGGFSACAGVTDLAAMRMRGRMEKMKNAAATKRNPRTKVSSNEFVYFWAKRYSGFISSVPGL